MDTFLDLRVPHPAPRRRGVGPCGVPYAKLEPPLTWTFSPVM